MPLLFIGIDHFDKNDKILIYYSIQKPCSCANKKDIYMKDHLILNSPRIL